MTPNDAMAARIRRVGDSRAGWAYHASVALARVLRPPGAGVARRRPVAGAARAARRASERAAVGVGAAGGSALRAAARRRRRGAGSHDHAARIADRDRAATTARCCVDPDDAARRGRPRRSRSRGGAGGRSRSRRQRPSRPPRSGPAFAPCRSTSTRRRRSASSTPPSCPKSVAGCLAICRCR